MKFSIYLNRRVFLMGYAFGVVCSLQAFVFIYIYIYIFFFFFFFFVHCRAFSVYFPVHCLIVVSVNVCF